MSSTTLRRAVTTMVSKTGGKVSLEWTRTLDDKGRDKIGWMTVTIPYHPVNMTTEEAVLAAARIPRGKDGKEVLLPVNVPPHVLGQAKTKFPCVASGVKIHVMLSQELGLPFDAVLSVECVNSHLSAMGYPLISNESAENEEIVRCNAAADKAAAEKLNKRGRAVPQVSGNGVH